MKAFFAGRPYHLFNAINYIVTNNCYADLYIANEYPQARNDYERVKRAGIFSNVFFVEESSLRPSNRIKELAFICKRALFPQKIIDSSIVEGKNSVNILSYTEIYTATPGTFVLSLLSVCKDAKYIVIEDGAGTYSGRDFLENQSSKHKLYCWVFKNGAMNLKVDSVLVYRPEMCHTGISNNIKQLPLINVNNRKLMQAYNGVFDYVNDKYYKRYIVLSQRLLGFDCGPFDLYNYCVDALTEAGLSGDYCYRLHPSEKEEDYNSKQCSFPHEMWELICMKYINNNNVLITINSTAAFSPYKIYGKEPFVIFLYKIVGLKNYDYNVSEDLVLSLKEQYSDPSKIIVPNNKEELCCALAQTKM